MSGSGTLPESFATIKAQAARDAAPEIPAFAPGSESSAQEYLRSLSAVLSLPTIGAACFPEPPGFLPTIS